MSISEVFSSECGEMSHKNSFVCAKFVVIQPFSVSNRAWGPRMFLFREPNWTSYVIIAPLYTMIEPLEERRILSILDRVRIYLERLSSINGNSTSLR